MYLSDLIQRRHYANIAQLAESFADYAAATLTDSLTKKPVVTLVVPGGNTPRYYLPALAAIRDLPWDKIVITLSDERWVDVNDEASNEHLVRKKLLEYLPKNTNFIGLKTQHQTPAEAIETIHQRLDNLPRPLSLTVLGLGEDGHIASLFPGMNPMLAEPYHCIAIDKPIALSPRISLSLNMLAGSQHIALVVVGKKKRQLLDRLGEHSDSKVPLLWLLQRRETPVMVFETDEV